jgi:hypothetical protein
MYSTRPGLVLGFHGTDKVVVENVVRGKEPLSFDNNEHDWLGHGYYFWEYSPARALEFARLLQKHPNRTKTKISEPAVLGAVLSLGKCLDLTEFNNLQLLKEAYSLVLLTFADKIVPLNRGVSGSEDLLLRELDCLVIETLHRAMGNDQFDSVKGVFWEGPEIYPTAGFREKNHIQICIRNPNCIKGYFLPRDTDETYRPI